MPTNISRHNDRSFFMVAQLRTDPLVQSEESQHASGSKNLINLLTIFKKRECMHFNIHRHQHKSVQNCADTYAF